MADFMTPLLLSLPDDLADWRGTADELAAKCNEILATMPLLAEDAGAANERLIRHYVQVGVLSAPEREGREALFGLRQVVEFLAARYLLKDGWPCWMSFGRASHPSPRHRCNSRRKRLRSSIEGSTRWRQAVIAVGRPQRCWPNSVAPGDLRPAARH